MLRGFVPRTALLLMTLRRKLALALGVLALLAAAAFFFAVAPFAERLMNKVALPPPYTTSAQAGAVHGRLFVADLHGDTLLWGRDLLTPARQGHVDLPRLQQGHVGLQVFATVTQSPRGLNFERNGSDTDTITTLVMAQRWPLRTWDSLLERALYQGEKLASAAERSNGALRFVRTRAELDAVLKAQAATPAGTQPPTAALLATEGLHPLEGKLENVNRLYDAGFRMAGITHFFDNELGGSAHGLAKGGLTPFGRDVVRRLEERKILIDLAHASPKVIDDVLAMAKRPVVVSHGGVQATCPGPRNLSDAHVRGIAATGGVIGIGYFAGAVCQLDQAAIVRAMLHVANLVGVKHVALGSDFDGATTTAFDTTGVPLITQALLEAGFSEADVAAIMGGNVRRLLLEQLP